MPLLSPSHTIEAPRFHAQGPRQLDQVATRYGLSPEIRETVRLLSLVFPFRVNDYVLSQLIDWRQVPNDPIFQLVFPQPGMLTADDERDLQTLSRRAASKHELDAAVRSIHARLNPHPAGQQELNVPRLAGTVVRGVQHKYRETVLYFPGHGQTCHAYCTYCFRWAQFVGDPDLRFATPRPDHLVAYLHAHPEVSDVLVTGGDPMVMSTQRLRQHLEPLLAVETVRTIRVGTKSVAYWPQRFVTDGDAEDALRLFEQVVASGRHLAVMMHFSHHRELATDLARRALARIRATGALLYCQAPLVAHVNDSARIWAELWRAELAAGAVPYYLFVARDTGPRDYFKVPLASAVEIFQGAYQALPGLARTVRGPVMSTTSGKVVVDGVEATSQGRFFQLRFLQAREPSLVGRPFHAHYSAGASWLDELQLEPGVPADLAAAVNSNAQHQASPAVAGYAPTGDGLSAMTSRGRMSPNLALDQLVAQRRASGQPVIHLGFGESGLPVFPGLAAQLAAGARRNAYGPVAGDPCTRQAAAGYFIRRRMPTEPDQVVIAPGSKPLLMAVLTAAPGDVLLPRPCWVTYGPQARLAGKRAFGVPIPSGCGGVPEPTALRQTIRAARAAGGDPRIVVLTLPDNPTGTIAPPSLVREICSIAEQEDLLIISDEIYRDIVHDPAMPVLSPAEVAGERTVVTTGLSKSHALGGWRIGLARFPTGARGRLLRDGVVCVASEVWSTLAGPMQQVAAYTFSEPPELRDHIAASTRLHGAIAAAVYRIVCAAGASCRRPTGGFYVYPDFEPIREALASRSCRDSASLQVHLLETYGIAVLGGHHFGDDDQALRFRAATSLLYGETDDQRWEALHAADPLLLPHIAAVLDRIEAALATLTAGRT